MLCVIEVLRSDAAKELEQAEKLAVKAFELRESAVLKLDYAAEVARVTAKHLCSQETAQLISESLDGKL